MMSLQLANCSIFVPRPVPDIHSQLGRFNNNQSEITACPEKITCTGSGKACWDKKLIFLWCKSMKWRLKSDHSIHDNINSCWWRWQNSITNLLKRYTMTAVLQVTLTSRPQPLNTIHTVHTSQVGHPFCHLTFITSSISNLMACRNFNFVLQQTILIDS